MSPMTDRERDAVLAICLRAAYADGAKDEAERARIERIARSLSGGQGVDLGALHEEVLLGKRTLEDTAAELGTPELRQLAYELAVGVCTADGTRTAAELDFLERLRSALGLEPVAARTLGIRADALAGMPLETPPAARPGAGTGTPSASPDPAALDREILDAAILAGALELLHESLAAVAILPLQMRLVYRIGRAHGYELDRGHVRELLATMGIGLASQYVEQVGRKIVGGILGAIGGGLLGGLGRQATGSALAFATTYALGQVARRYYAGGRSLDAQGLRQVFDSMLSEARGLAARYAGQIQERARAVDVSRLLAGAWPS